MSEATQRIELDTLKQQVAAYTDRLPHYKTYAAALKRVLEATCQAAFPEAFVQSRPKAVTSFAEKCVRKFQTYPDAVNQMTDLCGARVIVQTLSQVIAVRRFIEAHFDIVEADEKGSRLGADKFGYRDMHYIVRLPVRPGLNDDAVDEGAAAALGFTPDEIDAIGAKTAEIQVRTWVQHAWADILHDRMYKAKLKYPAEFDRTAALLAAIMEEGDRDFNRLAGELDGMFANFNAYAPRAEVEREIEVQELILQTAEDRKKPRVALEIARLVAAQGDYERVIAVLQDHAEAAAPLGCDIRLELGHALCRHPAHAPDSAAYARGQELLGRVVEHCRAETGGTAVDLRRRRGTLAKALARLAWSYDALDEQAAKARACHREALELEPGNPYYLADVVGHEINYLRRRDFVGSMAAGIRDAIATCHAHICNGTEMPYAAFTAGRLGLLLGADDQALGDVARGIRHVLDCESCVPADVFAVEKKWLILVTKPDVLKGGFQWAMDLLHLAERLHGPSGAGPAEGEPSGKASMKTPVFIVAGGAGSLKTGQADVLRPLLEDALTGFESTVISGGTRVGVPGCVGDAAEAVAPRGERPFDLIGYLPRIRPGDAPEDERYDTCIQCGEESFTAEQIVRNWVDLLDAGIRPDQVRVLGFGGGALSAVEYRIALGFGARVGVVAGSGGAADALLADPLWAGMPNLMGLPCDRDSVRALAHPPRAAFAPETLEKMARAFHEEYVANSQGRLPDNMKPWEKLNDTFRTANLEQAKYAVQILQARGFDVRPADQPVVFTDFTEEDIERMAEMEHGRWNVERLGHGWRFGTPRDDGQKLHDCIVPWTELPDADDGVKKYDRQSVRKFAEILARAGLEVRRR